jgi:hydroxyacylglutathione hydrolase
MHRPPPPQEASLTITPIPAFNDNYIWLLETGGSACAVVDPGDHRPVILRLEERGLSLDSILVTHHHADHIGGIPGLLARWPAEVIGPEDPRTGPRSLTVADGDTVRLTALGLEFGVLEVPGHTASHIAFHGHGALFCGDTLFSLGCGRLFEGSPAEMQASLDKLAALPPDTQVYCAHEYTRSNCAFALAVEPDNERLQTVARWIDEQRRTGHATVPSSLAMELQCNPFLRTREPPVVEAAHALDPAASPGASTLGIIRSWKDRFPG